MFPRHAVAVTCKLTSSKYALCAFITGFEQHFSIRFNDTFKRGFLHKIDRVNICSALVFWDRGKTLTHFETARTSTQVYRDRYHGVCNCKHCERVYDQDSRYLPATKNKARNLTNHKPHYHIWGNPRTHILLHLLSSGPDDLRLFYSFDNMVV